MLSLISVQVVIDFSINLHDILYHHQKLAHYLSALIEQSFTVP